MLPDSNSKKKFSMKSFASPKTRTTPDPEALQRLMEKTEVDGGGGLNDRTDSEVVAKLPTAIQAPANNVEPKLDGAPSIDEIPPPPVPTLPTGTLPGSRNQGRTSRARQRWRAPSPDFDSLTGRPSQARSQIRVRSRSDALDGDGGCHRGVARHPRRVGGAAK